MFRRLAARVLRRETNTRAPVPGTSADGLAGPAASGEVELISIGEAADTLSTPSPPCEPDTVCGQDTGAEAGPEPVVSPMPWRVLIPVLYAFFNEAALMTLAFPFVVRIVQDFGIGADKPGRVATYAGLLEATFAMCQLVSAYPMGLASDQFGRVPLLLFGLAGSGISMMLFGLSTSYWFALCVRGLSGLLNGNLGVVKAMLAEETDSTNSARAFAYLSLMFGLGIALAPLTASQLVYPANRWPHLFAGTIFDQPYPYLLACLFGTSISAVGFVISAVMLRDRIFTRRGGVSQRRGAGYDDPQGLDAEARLSAEHRSSESGSDTHGSGEFGSGEHGFGKHGSGEHGPGEHAFGGHGVGKHGFSEHISDGRGSFEHISDGRSSFEHISDGRSSFEHISGTHSPFEHVTAKYVSVEHVSVKHKYANPGGPKRAYLLAAQAPAVSASSKRARGAKISLRAPAGAPRGRFLSAHPVPTRKQVRHLTALPAPPRTQARPTLSVRGRPAAARRNAPMHVIWSPGIGAISPRPPMMAVLPRAHRLSAVPGTPDLVPAVEAAGALHPPTQTVSLFTFLANSYFRAGFIMYGLTAFCYMVLDSVRGIVVLLPIATGGMGLSTTDVGLMYLLDGIMLMLAQILIVPRTQRALGGPRALFRLGAILTVPSIALFPFLSNLRQLTAPGGTDTSNVRQDLNVTWSAGILFWAASVLWSMVYMTSSGYAYTACFQIINNSLPYHLMGRGNALGQMIASFARAASPALAGFGLSWSLRNGLAFPLDVHFIFLATAICIIPGLLIVARTPKWLDMSTQEACERGILPKDALGRRTAAQEDR